MKPISSVLGTYEGELRLVTREVPDLSYGHLDRFVGLTIKAVKATIGQLLDSLLIRISDVSQG
jgi:hypothetical protein